MASLPISSSQWRTTFRPKAEWADKEIKALLYKSSKAMNFLCSISTPQIPIRKTRSKTADSRNSNWRKSPVLKGYQSPRRDISKQ